MDSIAFGRDEKGMPIFKLWKINPNIHNESENIPLFHKKILAATLFAAATGKKLNCSKESAINEVKQEWNNLRNDEWENKLKLFVLRLLSEEQNMKAVDIMQFSKELLLLTSFIKPARNCKNIPRRFSDSDVHKAADENMKTALDKEIFRLKKELEEDVVATRLTLMNEIKKNEELTEMINSSQQKYKNEIEQLKEQLLASETTREKIELEHLETFYEIDSQLKEARQEIIELKRKLEFKKEIHHSRQNSVNEELTDIWQSIKNSAEENTFHNSQSLRSFEIFSKEIQNWKKSIEYFTHSLEIFLQLYNDDHDDVAFILNSMGPLHKYIGDK